MLGNAWFKSVERNTVAQWAIGDVQGCLGALRRLIAQIEAQDELAHFYFCGDLVNRGEDSLGTLDLIQSLAAQGRAQTVLGNHDLYALACVAGFVQAKPQDTLNNLLAAPQHWVDWLRQQPLAMQITSGNDLFLLSHAGVWPTWTAQQTLALASAVQTVLQADDWAQHLNTLWHGGARVWRQSWNKPALIDADKSDMDQADSLNMQRFTINALMRMRLIAPDGGLDFEVKESAAQAPRGYTPWFDMSCLAMRTHVLVFGHWSALGLRNQARMLALDTGCVWGRQLTGVELVGDVNQRRVVQVSAG